jgi:hypothetical protein
MATTNTCKKCGCQDAFLVSPAPCPTPADCPNPEPCSESFDAQCIVYTGDDILCLQNTLVSTNDSVADALVNIVEYFCESDSYISDVELQGTNLVFTGVNLAFDGTISLSGIGAGVTANNGLTMSTLTNVQLGGTLIQNTSINVQGFNFLFTGVRNTVDTILKITNSGTGGGLYAETTGNNPIGGFCNGNAAGGSFISATGSGIQAFSNSYTSVAGEFRNYSNLANSTTDVIEINSLPSGVTLPASGIASAIKFKLPKINGLGFKELTEANKIISKLTDVAEASVNSNLTFQGRTGGAVLQDLVTFKGDGEVQFHKYGVGNFVTAYTYLLGVDASGNVVEIVSPF